MAVETDDIFHPKCQGMPEILARCARRKNGLELRQILTLLLKGRIKGRRFIYVVGSAIDILGRRVKAAYSLRASSSVLHTLFASSSSIRI